MAKFALPFRQIHLDFHTGPGIPDVGRDFNADEFADEMKAAHVNSVTGFAKCHHGHLYYNTKHPARHPTLKPGLNLLGEQIEALHRRGIRAPIYISVQCDEYAGTTHPDWLALTPDGGRIWNAGPLSAGWHIVDMSSPYQDYLADQIEEVLRVFKPVDGLFLDMCWDQPSCSPHAIAGMLKMGLNPEREADRNRYAHATALRYMARYTKIIRGSHKGRTVPTWYNSRPLWNLAEEKKFLQHVEIEALPTGGWGYMYFPMGVRFVRTFGLPFLGMTGRFHMSWADFGGLKPEAALKYECCQMLAHGARCSVGDQLHPRGRLDRAAYELIGNVYRYVAACEPWCTDSKPVTEIAVLRKTQADYHVQPGDANEGVTRALQQLSYQFDFLPTQADFSRYALVIVPDDLTADAALAARLRQYLRRGGSLLLSGRGALDAAGQPMLPEQGIAAHGDSPFKTTYLRFMDRAADGVPATDHVIYEPGFRMTPTGRTRTLVRVVEPYFERTWQHFCSHRQTPPDKLTRFAAATQRGRVITIAYPIFKAYGTHGNLAFRHLIRAALTRLIPAPLVRAQGPSYLEVCVHRQGPHTVVHALSYCPIRRTQNLDIVEEPAVVPKLPLSVKLAHAPQKVTLQPQGERLTFKYHGGRAEVVIPELRGHTLIVFE